MPRFGGCPHQQQDVQMLTHALEHSWTFLRTTPSKPLRDCNPCSGCAPPLCDNEWYFPPPCVFQMIFGSVVTCYLQALKRENTISQSRKFRESFPISHLNFFGLEFHSDEYDRSQWSVICVTVKTVKICLHPQRREVCLTLLNFFAPPHSYLLCRGSWHTSDLARSFCFMDTNFPYTGWRFVPWSFVGARGGGAR